MVKITFFILGCLLLAGCASTRHLPQVVERIVHDTLYQNTLQYDSVYIDNTSYTYKDADTVYKEKVRYEYKYKLLRDTVRIHKVDSIPVVREVENVREVRTTPSYCKLLVLIAILLLTGIIIKTLK